MSLLLEIFRILFIVTYVYGYRILGLFPHHGRSHFDMFEPIMRELVERGHHVTVVSPYPQPEPIPNYRDISLSGSVTVFREVLTPNTKQNLKGEGFLMPRLYQFANDSCENGLVVKGVQDLINSNENFDVILAETFNSDCFLGFVHQFKAPLIGLSTSTPMPWATGRVGQPSNPAYIPDNFLEFSDKMTLFERVWNTVMYLYHNTVYKCYYLPNDQKIANKYFGKDLPTLEDIARNTSLILLNTHFSLNLPRPNVPSVVEIGGVHLRQLKRLPEDIENWVNNSVSGVIYFSMGSVIEGHTFPKDEKLAFIRAFARIKQRVLWKWDNGTMAHKTEQIMIREWLPQLDILCHPNVKAFISHGGLLSIIESVHCGVPLIVMPQFGDQFTNARAVEAIGAGIILNWKSVNEENILGALKRIVSPTFKKQAEELSARFRDRPMSPMDTAMYWIEYVARHKGARFMRTAAVDMPWYQYLLLDVIALLFIFLFAVSYIIFQVIKKFVHSVTNKITAKIKTD